MQKENLLQLNSDDIFKWLVLFYVIGLPFGTAISNIGYGLLICYWVVSILRKKIVYSKRDLLHCFIFSSYYLMIVISFFYSENQEYALKKILLQSYLLFIPLVIIGKKKVFKGLFFGKIISVFTLSLVLMCLLSFINQLIKFIGSNGSVYNYFFENQIATSVVDYYFLGLSLCVSIAVLSNIYLFIFYNTWLSTLYKRIIIPINSFLFLFLFLLNSRAFIIITVFLSFIIIVSSLVKKKNYRWAGTIFLFFLTIMVLNFSYNTKFNEKMKEAINYNNQYNIDNYWGGRGMRYLIWDSSEKLINDNLILGVGVGDQQDALTLNYKIYMKQQLLHNNSLFNAHNIFLQTLISTGVIGLSLFIFSIIYAVVLTIRNNLIYTLFIVVFLSAGLFESFLQRNLSIAFFAFFNITFFLISYQNEDSTSTQ
jgi:O-antigen ligase